MIKIILILLTFNLIFGLDKDQFYKDGYKFETDSGSFTIILFEDSAPNHCKNFKQLFNSDKYDSLAFHRVIAGFMNQIGDPNTKGGKKSLWGSGNIGELQDSEIDRIHFRGAVAAARLGDEQNPDKKSSGSQFYLCVRPQHQLDGEYTVFGSVVEGMDSVDKINMVRTNRKDRPVKDIRVISTEVVRYFDEKEYLWCKRALEERIDDPQVKGIE